MGNKRRVGSRYKAYKKTPTSHLKKTNRPRPTQTPEVGQQPIKTSSSKVKLENNFSYYDSKNETLSYDIIDLGLLASALKDMAVCKICKGVLNLTRKSVVGLATEVSIFCTECHNNKTFSNCEEICIPDTNTKLGLKETQKFFDLNIRLVYGMRAVGKGFTSAQTLCGILNIPSPPTKFQKHEMFISHHLELLCKESMKLAVEEAIAECESPNDRNLCVAVDGSWQKRGHTSLNGIVSVTSVDNGKVVDIEVMSKYCQCPDRTQNNHLGSCTANYLGTSGGMEVKGAIEIFKRSLPLYGVKYTEYLGDGDTNAYKSVSESEPYGPHTTISKLECVGHVQKRMGTRLRKLKEKSKKKILSDGKPLTGKNRLTDSAIPVQKNSNILWFSYSQEQ